MTLTACMGGWCRKRDGCAHYHAEERSDPVERLCAKGLDEPVPREPGRGGAGTGEGQKLIGPDDPRWWGVEKS